VLYSLRAPLFKETKAGATKTEVRGGKGEIIKPQKDSVGQKEVEAGELIGLVQKTGTCSGVWLERCM